MIASAARRATISDVARAAGVSPATVSRVLNRNPTVAPELVTRVDAAVRAVNYRPNGAGRALRRQRSDLWGVIVPDLRNPFFHLMIHEFQQVATAAGYSVVLSNSQEDLGVERSAIEAMVDHQVSGVMVAVVSDTESRLDLFTEAGIPVVTVDRRVEVFNGDVVNVDNERIGWLAADHFLERGWRNPVVLSHSADLSPLRDRERGFLQRLAAEGIEISDSRIALVSFVDARDHAVVDETITSLDGFDAIFAVTNSLTALAYNSLRRLQRRPGRDVALIGVDDDHWNEMVDPSITVIDQQADKLGRHAGQILLARTNGAGEPPEPLLLEPLMTVRASTAPRA